ncbi:hypothetical protein [Vogesella sp. LIG4]|uniref:hypothetical protein n=1 Tax=Vogesella sp. LIG4 TaxID=1192162 RepID=UPI00081FA8D9|nr:hypothetical protein [Vogesella sp. LIG4]SCK17916.1 hypothetical protein PSELUDRAFT_1914 [Vogesella sp. LIG4]
MKKLAALAVLPLIACSKFHGETWTATKDMPAFEQANDDLRNPVFTIKQGEACTPLDESVQKVYAYTKVRCSNKEGWVVDDAFQK